MSFLLHHNRHRWAYSPPGARDTGSLLAPDPRFQDVKDPGEINTNHILSNSNMWDLALSPDQTSLTSN